MAVMAAICGLKDAQPNMILRSVFRAGLDLKNNAVYHDLVKYHADGAFWAMVRQGCGFVEEEPDLGRLAIHLLLTAATRTMQQEYLAGLDGFISMPHQAYCYDFISEWLHSKDIQQLYDVARYVEDEARLHQRFEKLTVDNLAGTECFPCINEVILTKLMTEISDHIIDVDIITSTVEKRRTCAWYEPFENFYDGILQVANMQSFFREHSAGFHTAEAKGIWKEYTESYYQMDTYYRLFHLSFQKSLETSNILLDDLFKHVVDKVEGLYTHWFLGELGNNWSDVCADELATYGKVLEVPQQEEFYRSRIKTSDTKVFVIISDAMRYEVAAAMADQLQRETQSKVSISSMQSIFPSITKFGMAALLPHKELTVEVRNDVLTVLADGQSTASTYRDKALKSEDPASVALKYNDIIAMKRAERSALVKGMDVVYIYHDTIDEASHTSDTAVFSACDKAISELKNLVRIIVNEFGGTNILITADHGFLYTYGDALDHYFRLGRNLNQRDTIAVRRMMDGYLKLMYPNGEFIKEELEEIIQIALEMRRRVKEQLKKLGGMEFYDVNFSYIDLEDMSEHYVSVPEQGGGKLIPDGMCNPGQVYTVSRGKSGMIGVFRLESQMLPGNGKIERTGLGSDSKCKEAVNTAFNYLKANGNRISGTISTSTKDYIINYQDLLDI